MQKQTDRNESERNNRRLSQLNFRSSEFPLSLHNQKVIRMSDFQQSIVMCKHNVVLFDGKYNSLSNRWSHACSPSNESNDFQVKFNNSTQNSDLLSSLLCRFVHVFNYVYSDLNNNNWISASFMFLGASIASLSRFHRRQKTPFCVTRREEASKYLLKHRFAFLFMLTFMCSEMSYFCHRTKNPFFDSLSKFVFFSRYVTMFHSCKECFFVSLVLRQPLMFNHHRVSIVTCSVA